VKKILEQVDDAILEASAENTKKSYERYKTLYEEKNYAVHSEDSMLNFLLYMKNEKKYVPTSLFTVRSLVTNYLFYKCKVKITDDRSTA
jgi:hypothetical protein